MKGKIYIDGRRRRFRKSIPADGSWHHLVVVGKKQTAEILGVKVGRRTSVARLYLDSAPSVQFPIFDGRQNPRDLFRRFRRYDA